MKRVVHTGDLLDENFTHLEAYISGERRISGWDTDLGDRGAFDYGFADWFKLIDGGGRGITMVKRFVAQNSGSVTLEFRFRTPVKIPSCAFELRCGSIPAIRIITGDSAIMCGERAVAAYEADTEYGVKVEARIDGQNADIYVGGQLKAENVPFENRVACLDHIAVTTPGTEAGREIFIDPIRIYKGYALHERFLTCAPGSTPSGWTISPSDGGAAREFRCGNAPDLTSYKLEPGAELSARFGALDGSLIFEYRFLLPEMRDGAGAVMTGGGVKQLEARVSGGYFYVNGAEMHRCVRNLWHHVKIAASPARGEFEVFVNGKRKGAGRLEGDARATDGLTLTAGDGACWIDDIMAYEARPEPEDYVPAPKPVNGRGRHTVGMQVCSLWREGHHNGWDFIKQYPERKPLLGWYEEGLPELSDWEIKWMAEHGVDFQLYCWYRPGAGMGNPIKDPTARFNLHDGYFYAKYSSALKFAVMFENGNSRCDGFKDLTENLIPFWNEYYFRDPRYMSVDGRAVFGIYSVDGLIRDFGSVENARRAVDLIRGAIVACGFSDALMLCECRDKSLVMMHRIKEAGFDAIYSYTWYTGDPQVQMAKMRWQRDTGIIDVVPTASMGWHTAPWGGKDASFATPKEFGELCEWVRDVFTPEGGIVMLDNWNEYGEGHFMMPAGLAGFGYLDAVRRVFGASEDAGGSESDGGGHTDDEPTSSQLARLDTLYPKGDW